MSDSKELGRHQIAQDRIRLRVALAMPGMSCRNVAAFTGTSKATISRMQNHHQLSAENYLSIHHWLNSLSPTHNPDRNEAGE